MSEGIRVAAADEIGEGEAVTVDARVAGTADDIAVFHSDDGNFYALNDTCTHEEASLSEGWIEDGEVECPVHSARFCLKTGQALCLPATVNAVAHRVEVVDGDVILHPGDAPAGS
ncbi:bifunctional 3-phenylpropionate/cinnamic acid dioxygenase ferredoxin subunit [Arthrobacter caoxuetaonis]|uniref:Bifunctional 3-phenylpropionate/cinnamic acid dioxygenase ferredoxin subunit n=1 Tax=Arthrobacter caoxuetaonis TaxID=2886935 RepID=A0A9X1MBZ2_9MICC|nr:bifunctional 3-phenylpropionate/cinnamic acid dioxygenase ferredoxin subunit [Arthrobacter caoxuetaonis]MCC3281519.1 bifunctional 3-phenylpropionate/cinnamic acid dioxygenase ferredoxin subunit [Arthrobacter caoxuetaonis]MCC3296227.1 bifunctional 3-phenylpropionate/cinnamic acid dioxygenase ferredoxin subunit [Arthrobacter caoxuetaonis]USQ56918.1 bifunctional 3-phenylpropionate/cinnamic acid dioxygenase ferredoxin subunit [Arthrobacter caoxuetaonis]